MDNSVRTLSEFAFLNINLFKTNLIKNQLPLPLFRKRRSIQIAKHTNRLPMKWEIRFKIEINKIDDKEEETFQSDQKRAHKNDIKIDDEVW